MIPLRPSSKGEGTEGSDKSRRIREGERRSLRQKGQQAHGVSYLPDMGEILTDESAVSLWMWLKRTDPLVAGPCFVLGHQPGATISIVPLTLEPGTI